MTDRRRTPPTGRTSSSRTSSRTFRERPDRERKPGFSPVRGDLMTRARSAADAVRERSSPTSDRAAGSKPGQGAIDFGRSMTGGGGAIDQVKNAIVGDVAKHLASKGIYQDDRGTWQIKGLERNDPSLDIRDSAVAGMGGPSWSKIVGDTDARLGANNMGLGAGSAASTGVKIPTAQDIIAGMPKMTPVRPSMPSASGTPSIPGRAPTPIRPVPQPGLGGTPPMTRTTPGAGGPVPSPGLGGVPAPAARPDYPPGRGAVPQPGLGGTPPTSPYPTDPGIWVDPQTKHVTVNPGVWHNGVWSPPPNPFPPQGQGVGRTTTPTGAQVDPGQYPVTGTPPVNRVPGSAQGSTMVSPGLGGGSMPPPAPPPFPAGGQAVGSTSAPSRPAPLGLPGTGQLQAQPAPAVAPDITNVGGSPRIGMGSGGQIIGSGLGQETNLAPFPAQGAPAGQPPISPSNRGSQTVGGVAPATPAVTPATPVTPTRPPVGTSPGRMPSVFPNGKSFGGSNPMVDQIQQQVQQRISAQMGGGALPGSANQAAANPALAGLQGLGDRIAASVQGGLAGMRQAQGGMPAPGAPNLDGLRPGGVGTAASEIMAQVQRQLAASRIPARPDVMGTPTTGMPTTGMPTTGSGVPPGGPTTPTSTMPTGTGSLGTMGGRYAGLDQYNASFEAAGAEFGVPPELLKSMAGIESGWTDANVGCRDDGYGDGASCGLMQIKGGIWDKQIGCDTAASVDCNIRAAAMILKQGYDACGNWDCAITTQYFPADDPNGTTQTDYLNAVHQSMTEQAGNPGTGQPTGQVIGAAPTGQVIGQGGDPNSGTLGLPPTGPGGQQIDPATGAPIQATPVTGAGGGGLTNQAGVPITPTGESPASPVNPSGKIPAATGAIELTTPADGMGIAATPATDDSWLNTAFGPGASISTSYKQPVTWSCTACGQGCLYNYQCAEAGNGYVGADASTHAGMDILCAQGDASENCRNSPVNSPTSGTVLCTGGQGGGGYQGCNFATSPSVVDNGGVGQITLNVGNDVSGNMITMDYWHMQTSNVQVGQQINPGDTLGGMGSMGGMVHTHVEAHGYCPQLGGYVTLDPTLVNDGYYSTHSPCEGYV